MPTDTTNTRVKERDPTGRSKAAATTIELSGVSSAAGLIGVERELEAVDGVHGAVIDVTTGRARVIHTPARGNAQAFIAAVRRAGFDAERPRAREVRA